MYSQDCRGTIHKKKSLQLCLATDLIIWISHSFLVTLTESDDVKTLPVLLFSMKWLCTEAIKWLWLLHPFLIIQGDSEHMTKMTKNDNGLWGKSDMQENILHAWRCDCYRAAGLQGHSSGESKFNIFI